MFPEIRISELQNKETVNAEKKLERMFLSMMNFCCNFSDIKHACNYQITKSKTTWSPVQFRKCEFLSSKQAVYQDAWKLFSHYDSKQFHKVSCHIQEAS